jgi:D-glycero-D-manno-heptose 1,7-bisphosphate phosphatase
MTEQMNRAGAKIDALYYCPHAVEDSCMCRKPELGMFLQAFKDFPQADRSASFVLGDSLCDMQGAHRLNCRKVLIAENQAPIITAASEIGISINASAPSLLQAVTDFVLPQLHRSKSVNLSQQQ